VASRPAEPWPQITKRWKYGPSPGGGTRALYGSQDGRRYEICAGREDFWDNLHFAPFVPVSFGFRL